MRFEIDMLNVGNADAIVLRYWGEDDREVVVLIDAGRAEHGPVVLQHIQKYTEQQKVNLAICTHSDEDHIGGFEYLFDQGLEIDEFWMHNPSNYRDQIMLLKSQRSVAGISSLNESLQKAIDLMTRIDNDMQHQQPFTGLVYDLAPLSILAPTESYFITKLKGFRKVKELFEVQRILYNPVTELLLESLTGIDSSKENNSSVITYFHPGKFKYLFTSDADVTGLEAACNAADLQNLDWLQIPHHGSRNNINSYYARLLNPKTAYVSAGGYQDKPHPEVIDLFKNETRAEIFTTVNCSLLHRYNTNARPGYGRATPV